MNFGSAYISELSLHQSRWNIIGWPVTPAYIGQVKTSVPLPHSTELTEVLCCIPPLLLQMNEEFVCMFLKNENFLYLISVFLFLMSDQPKRVENLQP